jgi:hypothetical protein
MGIPTMVVTRVGFSNLVANSFAGLGFPPEAPTVYEFPIEMFLAGADLTLLKENIDKIVYGLTKWEAKTKVKGIFNLGKITVQGKDYQEAVDKMDQMFLKNMWGDGLPITPATRERVNWILTGTDLPRNSVVGTGKILPRGGIATVESLAIALAMAGGRPEYLPVLIAAVDAITEPEARHSDWNATTSSSFPAVIVSGPIGQQIRLGSRYGVTGPDPMCPAGGPIGRAIRLILMNLGGAVPGVGTMAIFGGGRYTNAVFAEDEEGIPQGWQPLGVEQGFSKGRNVVTVVPVSGAANVQFTIADAKNIADLQLQYLHRMAAVMSSPGGQIAGLDQKPGCISGIVLLGRGQVKEMAKQGWSKEKIRAFLWENSKIPWSVLVKAGKTQPAKDKPDILIPEGKDLPLAKPMIVVAGGDQSGHGYWMQVGKMSVVKSKEIKLPAKWSDLLKAAEADLGPIPAQ